MASEASVPRGPHDPSESTASIDRKRFLRRTGLVVLTVVALVAAGCGESRPPSASGTTKPMPTEDSPSSIFAVPAVRDQLATSSQSPVVHDNEIMALAAQSGRLFAATDQWEYPGPSAYGQILVKNSPTSPWRIFEQTQSTRVQALDSFPIPSDQGLGPGHSLLVTQAIVNGRSEIQWLIDGATSFAPDDSFVLASSNAAVRSFGAHESDGVWAIYAGVGPTGILQGIWSPTSHTLVFEPTPELSGASPGSPGLKTQKVTGFANCGGALYVSINTKLFRRNDGSLPSGVPRWTLVDQEPPVGPFNSGLRGISCVSHEGSPSLLFSTEGSGNVYRLDHLPTGQLPDTGTMSLSHPYPGVVSTLEFTPATAIRQMLATEGTAVPATGTGSIDYVIAAYNNFETITIDGSTRQLFGLEFSFSGGCPKTEICAPSGFDASACFAIRTDGGRSPTYVLRCLTGPQFKPSQKQPSPVRSGQAFVSIRTIKLSPFGDGRIYYGGYDNDFHPADGAAWIASSTSASLRLGGDRGTTGA
jgi:hypothetical protein